MFPTIAYYVENSIHQIPSFIYVYNVTRGKILTESSTTYEVLMRDYPGVDAELLPDKAAIGRRLAELSPSAVVHPDYTAKFFPDVRTKHVQVFHGTSDKPYGLAKEVLDYDLVLLPGQKEADSLARVGLLAKMAAEIVGYPKLDRVFRGEVPRDAKLAELGLDPARATVLYAPTWRDSWNNSSIPRYYREVISGAPDDLNLIVKLHPLTKSRDKKYYPLIADLCSGKPNIKLIDFAADVIPVMAASDLMIGDISSVTHEYLAFDRPLVFLDPILRFGGRRSTWVWQAGDVVRRKGRVWDTVVAALSHPDAHKPERQKCFQYIFHKPDGRAAERSAEAISRLVGAK